MTLSFPDARCATRMRAVTQRRWIPELHAVTAFALLCALAAGGCSGPSERNAAPGGGKADAGRSLADLAPPSIDPEAARTASALADSAYVLLDAGKNAEAIALFEAARTVLPASRWGHYNLACAWSRSGDTEKAFQELSAALAQGWDDAGHLEVDPDLQPLRADARFATFVEQARATGGAKLAVLAQGLPLLPAPQGLASADSVKSWARSAQERLFSAYMHYTAWQLILGRAAIASQRIAAMRALALPDSTFDEGRERMRALSRLMDPTEEWGPLADGVLHETDSYLKGNPPPEGRDEALYWSGVAAFCRDHPRPAGSGWQESVAAARRWFDRIPRGSKFEGGAAAWTLEFDLASAGESKEALNPPLRAFGEKYRDDPLAQEIAFYFFRPEMIRAAWPIPFQATDMDGRSLTLDQYRGRVLLLCYWASW